MTIVLNNFHPGESPLAELLVPLGISAGTVASDPVRTLRAHTLRGIDVRQSRVCDRRLRSDGVHPHAQPGAIPPSGSPGPRLRAARIRLWPRAMPTTLPAGILKTRRSTAQMP